MMAVRRVPEDHPDLQSAIDVSAPGDRIEVGPGVFPSAAVVTVDGLTIDHAGSFFSSDVVTLGPGVRSLALPGPTLFRATGNDEGNLITGGAATGYLYGRGGGDVLVGGAGAQWMEGGPGDDTYAVDDAAAPGGQGGGNRIPLFFGDRAVERPDEGWDAVWAGVDYALPGHVEGLVLTGGARRGYGNEAPNLIVGNGEGNLLAGLGGGDEMRGGGGDDVYLVNGRGDRVVEGEGQGTDEIWATADYELPPGVENLFLDGAAVWGSGNDLGNRIVGNDLDNRLVGWAGSDTLTGGAGGDIFYLLAATASFRATITDFRPGPGSDDLLAFSRGLFASREQALAAARQEGPDVWMVRDGIFVAIVVLQNTRMGDIALDDIVIV
jgi:Ca2+-binding RTX toxin-like protein